MRAALLAIALAACGDDAMMFGPDAAGDPDAELVDGAPDAGLGDPTADELRALIASCTVIGGKYATDSGDTATIDVCGLAGAVHWTGDMDIDCDGQMSAQCNSSTDSSYLPQTAAVDSMGDYLNAATLPFVVVPVASARWNFRNHGLALGSVAAVVYQDRVEYGVLGDLGPTTIIGEASYAMAAALSINPDPSIGGTDGPVAYLAFTGPTAEVDTMEDHAEARLIGIAHAKMLLGR